VTARVVFVTGATGYMGRALIPRLLARGHRVLALARRAGARRLGLVTLRQMTAALVLAVENPPRSVRIATVPEIRAAPAV
jgi:uncharacterized protein YbjT (DUF2867 family)